VRRVGHAGTLDPAATGVLPVLLGAATRLTEYLVDATKTYTASIDLGIETDTYDAEGHVLARADASQLGRDKIEAALARFRGDIEQAPPAFSAIKRAGVPLYVRARRGEAVDVPKRRVRVDRLQLISTGESNNQPLTAQPEPVEGQPSFDQPSIDGLRLVVEIDCSKGFYVRSLAHDLGAALGVGGSLAGLVRDRVGYFRLEDAVQLDDLRAAFEADSWRDLLFAPDEVLLDWNAAVVGPENERRLLTGRDAALATATAASGDRCRAYSVDGDFLGVLRRRDGVEWRPEKVIASRPPWH
jgi:tRNA pseudouridine55 synthase